MQAAIARPRSETHVVAAGLQAAIVRPRRESHVVTVERPTHETGAGSQPAEVRTRGPSVPSKSRAPHAGSLGVAVFDHSATVAVMTRHPGKAELELRRPQRHCRVRERAGWVPNDELRMLQEKIEAVGEKEQKLADAVFPSCDTYAHLQGADAKGSGCQLATGHAHRPS